MLIIQNSTVHRHHLKTQLLSIVLRISSNTHSHWHRNTDKTVKIVKIIMTLPLYYTFDMYVIYVGYHCKIII